MWTFRLLTPFYIAAGYLLLILASIALPGHTRSDDQVGTDRTDGRTGAGLMHRLRSGGIDSPTTTNAFLRTITDAGTPGGVIEITRCGQEEKVHPWEKYWGIVVQTALNSIVQEDPRYKWELTDGAVDLVPTDGEPRLLGTVIRSFDLDGEDSILDAVSRLFSLPEVTESANELHLKQGYTRIPSAYCLGCLPHAKFSVHISGVTLRQALNAVAVADGKGVWIYSELHCGDRNEYTYTIGAD